MFFLKKSPNWDNKYIFLLAIVILAIGLTSCMQKQGPIQELQAKKQQEYTQGYGTSFTSKELYRINCVGCHGGDRLGNPPNYPSLINIKAKLAKSEVQEILEKGKDRMPNFQHLSPKEKDAIIAFLFDEEQQSVELSTAELGQRIFKSNCASCHRATANDPRPPNVQCCEPAPLAGATKRFTHEEFLRILDTGVCYMPSYAHFSTVERDALYGFIKTLEGKGEPARPTMGEMCPMVLMVAKKGEYPQEYPSGTGAKEPTQGDQKEHSSLEKLETTKESLEDHANTADDEECCPCPGEPEPSEPSTGKTGK